MTAASTAGSARTAGGIDRLWRRQLHHYPGDVVRFTSLAIVVTATVVLYYQLYIAGAVATQIIRDYNMSFVYYVNISVVGYILGALASVVAGLADRYGRANIVTAGLLITALLCLFGVPNVHSKVGFAIVFIAIGFVEGIILVATPALVRDFSPQLGRASAMGFWTLGPVVGSLVVSIVTSNTLDHLGSWRDQYVICGIVGLVVFALALFGLRELAPRLRDQLMVSSRDRALIEARAKGIDVEASLASPFRQMLHLDIIGSAIAISLFLIIYYVAVGFFPIYFQTIFGFTPSQSNALGNWVWAFDAGALLVIGYVSDKLRVRKPFMVVGAIGSIVMTLIFAQLTTHQSTGYYTFVVILSLLAIFLGTAYAPWMASFTETVERRNPALTATGLAVWGLIIRIVIAVSIFFVPLIVDTVTTLVEKGPAVQEAQAAVNAKSPTLLPAIQAHPDVVAKVAQISAADADVIKAVQANPQLVAQLATYPSPAAIPPDVLQRAVAALGVPVLQKLATPQVQQDLQYLTTTAPQALGPNNLALLADPQVQANLKELQANGAEVQKAAQDSPKQWRTYYWIAAAGELVFIPLIWVMAGFWDPRKARRQEEEHEAWVEAELVRLEQEQATPA